MKQWYLFYTQGREGKLQRAVGEWQSIDVQWSFKGISTPMGVATYNNIRIKDALPSQEQLAERVRLLQRELQETKRLMGKNRTV